MTERYYQTKLEMKLDTLLKAMNIGCASSYYGKLSGFHSEKHYVILYCVPCQSEQFFNFLHTAEFFLGKDLRVSGPHWDIAHDHEIRGKMDTYAVPESDALILFENLPEIIAQIIPQGN